jgi:hypothetical protein
VDEICTTLELKLCLPVKNGDSAFLGAGTYGRVVRAIFDGEPCALKVALPENSNTLIREHKELKRHSAECGCKLLVKPSDNCCTLASGLTGYFMTPVGSECVKSEGLTTNMLKRVVWALYDLHTHKPLIIHGDPRLANIVVVKDDPLGESLVWIDVAATTWTHPSNTKSLITQDITILMDSACLYFDEFSERYAGVCKARDDCSERITRENYFALADALVVIHNLERKSNEAGGEEADLQAYEFDFSLNASVEDVTLEEEEV